MAETGSETFNIRLTPFGSGSGPNLTMEDSSVGFVYFPKDSTSGHVTKTNILQRALSKMDELLKIREPSNLSSSYGYAKRWLRRWEELVLGQKLELRNPHITFDDEDDEVVLEWWNGKKKLSVFIGPSSEAATSIRVWGPSITSEMQDGEVASTEGIVNSWLWLNR